MVVYSSVILLFVPPVLLVSFLMRRQLGVVQVGEHSWNVLPYQFHTAVTSIRRVCYLLGLLPVVMCFISFVEFQGGGESFYLSKLLSNVPLSNQKNCVDIAATYTPQQLVGIYGDMKGQYHRNIYTEHSSEVSLEISSEHSLVQELFDQGMLHTYGFNTVEGIRNFRAALKIDPNCAMCYWGMAYSNGPNINTDVTADMALKGREAINKALALITVLTPPIQDSEKNNENSDNAAKEGNAIKNKNRISEANKALIIAQETEFSFSSIEEWTEKTQKYYDLKYLKSLKIKILLNEIMLLFLL